VKESEGSAYLAENTGSAREVFAGLHEQYMPSVYKYINYRADNVHLAEDLTSAVFEKALL